MPTSPRAFPLPSVMAKNSYKIYTLRPIIHKRELHLPTMHFDSLDVELRVADPGVLGDLDVFDFVALEIDPADLPELQKTMANLL